VSVRQRRAPVTRGYAVVVRPRGRVPQVAVGTAAVLVLLAGLLAVGLPGSRGLGLSTGFAVAAALLVPLGVGGLVFAVGERHNASLTSVDGNLITTNWRGRQLVLPRTEIQHVFTIQLTDANSVRSTASAANTFLVIRSRTGTGQALRLSAWTRSRMWDDLWASLGVQVAEFPEPMTLRRFRASFPTVTLPWRLAHPWQVAAVALAIGLPYLVVALSLVGPPGG
jgi:hypothetical protein